MFSFGYFLVTFIYFNHIYIYTIQAALLILYKIYRSQNTKYTYTVLLVITIIELLASSRFTANMVTTAASHETFHCLLIRFFTHFLELLG
jgi:hypothetical protein